MLNFKDLHVGYDPRRNPHVALWLAVTNVLIIAAFAVAMLFLLVPIRVHGTALGLFDIWEWLGYPLVDRQIAARLSLGTAAGFVSGAVTFVEAWRRTPLSEPFRQVRGADPHLYYGEYARENLKRRLFEEAGSNAEEGLYLAPHLALPRSAETKNILVVGAPNSGKSNIIRALADQSIERGDRVLLLCNKGDVTASFATNEAVLIAAHHRDSFALDLAADVDDVAAAQQFATDGIPASTPPFWSDSARTVFTDILLTLQNAQPGRWTAHTLLRASLSDSNVIRCAIAEIMLNAGPILDSSDPDAEDKTVQGILLTMRTAALANLRPLAWAWANTPPERRFSIKRWLSDGSFESRTVIVQYSADYRMMSTLVTGSILRRIGARLADPQLAIDPARRVVLVLDEFHLLGKVEGLDEALGVGREKGLVLVAGLQTYNQLNDAYGETGAQKLLDLFGIKIFGRLPPGSMAQRATEVLGQRDVSTLIENRTPAKDDQRRYVEERKEIPTFSPTQLASQLGVFRNADGTGNLRALVQCYGQAYLLEWPFTTWRRKRPGFTPASWLRKPPKTRQPKG